jgi:hypothetical protein
MGIKTKVFKKRISLFFTRKRYVGSNPKLKSAVLILFLLINDMFIWNTLIDGLKVYDIQVVRTDEVVRLVEPVKAEAQPKEVALADGDLVSLTLEQKIERAFPEDYEVMLAIAKAESGLTPDAVNNRNRNGSIDTGLFQINSIHGYDSEWLKDVDNNIEAAKKVYEKQGLKAWAAYNNKSYAKHLTNEIRTIEAQS